MKTKTDEIKSKIKIKHSGNAYLIEIEDEFSKNELAVSREELEKIILYGQKILLDK